MLNHRKKYEWDIGGDSSKAAAGGWQWYDGGKRQNPLSGAERVRRLRESRSKMDRAVQKAVDIARGLQKAVGGPMPPKTRGRRCFKAGQSVAYVTVSHPLLRLQGKVVGSWKSSRSSLYGTFFWIVERCRGDLKRDKRLGKYVAVAPQNIFPL